MGYTPWGLEESDTTERLSTKHTNITLVNVGLMKRWSFHQSARCSPRVVSKAGQDLLISLILPQYLDHLFTASC